LIPVADTTPGVLTLPDIAYERAPVRVKIEGRAIAVDGWVRGPGCPARVVAEFARKHHQFAVSPDAPAAAYVEYLTDVLRVVLPDLTADDADAIAGDESRAETIMRHLKWFKAEEPEEFAEDPEATGQEGTPTTHPSWPTSSPTSEPPALTVVAG